MAKWRNGRQYGDMRRGLGWGAAVLAVQVLLGYWWIMAYTQGPDRTTPGECPACFRRAVREQNTFEAVDPTVVFLIWVGVNLALLGVAVGLLRRRREASPQLSAFTDPW